MSKKHFLSWLGAAALGVAGASVMAQDTPPPVPRQAPDAALAPAPDGDVNADPNVDVLLKGPIHEAYATPVVFDPQESPIINKKPPEPLVEDPPEKQLAGEDVVWIPGYWSYDDERNDYIWISGLWRRVPPGQRWVPGYWGEAQGGFQWVPGAWMPEAEQEVTYLPAPPLSQERGPNSPAPSDDHFWSPGCWMYYDTGYRWQPGFWAAYQPGWVWEPPCYRRAAFGYTFSAGYWDYAGIDRGCMFAPVYFRPGFSFYNGYRYRPFTAISSNYNLFFHLFVDTRRNGYAFGDFYGGGFGNRYRPWYDTRGSNWGYSPMLSYYDTLHRRQGTDYIGRLQGWNRYFNSNPDFRPRGTYRDQVRFDRDHRDFAHRDQVSLGLSLSQLGLGGNSNLFVNVNSRDRDRFDRERDSYRRLATDRRDLENRLRNDRDRDNDRGRDIRDGDRGTIGRLPTDRGPNDRGPGDRDGRGPGDRGPEGIARDRDRDNDRPGGDSRLDRTPGGDTKLGADTRVGRDDRGPSAAVRARLEGSKDVTAAARPTHQAPPKISSSNRGDAKVNVTTRDSDRSRIDATRPRGTEGIGRDSNPTRDLNLGRDNVPRRDGTTGPGTNPSDRVRDLINTPRTGDTPRVPSRDATPRSGGSRDGSSRDIVPRDSSREIIRTEPRRDATRSIDGTRREAAKPVVPSDRPTIRVPDTRSTDRPTPRIDTTPRSTPKIDVRPPTDSGRSIRAPADTGTRSRGTAPIRIDRPSTSDRAPSIDRSRSTPRSTPTIDRGPSRSPAPSIRVPSSGNRSSFNSRGNSSGRSMESRGFSGPSRGSDGPSRSRGRD